MTTLSKNAKVAVWVLGILLLIGLVYFAYFSTQKSDTFHGGAPLNQPLAVPTVTPTTTELAAEPPAETPTAEPSVRIASVSIPVELARTREEVRQGLSGRPSLPADEGMLFIFAEPDFYRFWMPDMNFPIDIIWINGGKVVDISHDVSNQFDPADPRFYTPSEPAQYVLEVNAGFAAQKDLTIGNSVAFSNVF